MTVAVELLNVADVLALVELNDVAIIEARAARKVELILPQPEESAARSNEVFVRTDGEHIDVRVVSVVESEEARVEVDILVQYSKGSPFEVSDEALQEFVQRVGIMTAYPYLRAAVADLTARLGVERITMPLLRNGNVTLTPRTNKAEEHAE